MRKGFTLIELIVVIAIISILVLLGSGLYKGYTKEAELTKHISFVKGLESASERYYIKEGKWPRMGDVSYNKAQLDSYSERIVDITGKDVTLDPLGSYYDINYLELAKYTKIPVDKENYILQNPVGRVYYLTGITEEGLSRGTQIEDPNEPEVALPVTDSLLLWLNRESAKGNVWEDISGKGTHGQLQGFNLSSCWTDYGLRFDGVDDTVVFTPKAEHKPTNMTIELTLKSEKNPNGRRGVVFVRWYGYTIEVTPLNAVDFGVYGNGTYLRTPPQEWGKSMHIVGVFDGKTQKVYINGVLAATQNAPYPANYSGTYTDLAVSSRVHDVFKGEINEIRFYERALNQEEVLQNYNSNVN